MIAAATGLTTPLERAIHEVASRPVDDPLEGWTVPSGEAARLVARFGLGSTTELAIAAVPVARQLARPMISGYHVGVVGIEAEGEDLVLGGNLEFPGTELGTTVHAEGFVTLRVRRRGRTLATLALRVAHPCAHCRQVLSESASAEGLLLVDTEGSRLRMDDIYPWPFRPVALDLQGDQPDRTNWPGLAFDGPGPPAELAALLVSAGSRAHAPYSGAPSAAVLRAGDGRLVSAGCLESVAFNPSISALQAALVELAAASMDAADVTEAWLGCTADAAVDPEPGFRTLAAAALPGARVAVARWRTDP